MKATSFASCPALTTVYLEYAGYDWRVFGQVGGSLLMYDPYIGVIIPHSGIFRASEIAAWHAMACACFVVLLMTLRKINFSVLANCDGRSCPSCGNWTFDRPPQNARGVMVFVSAYVILWIVFQKGVAKLGIILAIAGVIGFAVPRRTTE